MLLCLTLHCHHFCRAEIPKEHTEEAAQQGKVWSEHADAYQFPLKIKKLEMNPEEFRFEGMPLGLYT